MTNSPHRFWILCLLATLPAADAPPLLSPLFGDHAVVQQGKPIPVWGWATAGTPVTVEMGGAQFHQRVTGTADDQGRWQVQVGPLPAGTPLEIDVTAGGRSLQAKDLLAGDVWLCSGQSNMELRVSEAGDAVAETAAATWPGIRQFRVDKVIAGDPATSLGKVHWEVCTPKNVGNFTAAGYYFARDIHRDMKIPVGLVNASYGGTAAECWIEAEALGKLSEYGGRIGAFQDLVRRSRAEESASGKDYSTRVREWYVAQDPGSAGPVPLWAADEAPEPAAWHEVQLPAWFKRTGSVAKAFTGTLWLRRQFEVSAEQAGKPARLNLTRVKDMNAAWLNGTSIGDTESVNWLRSHRVPQGLLKKGLNTLAIRLVCLEGECGMMGPEADLALNIEGGGKIPLAGPWQLRLGCDFAQVPPMPARFDRVPGITSLYNGMIAPVLPVGLTGILWYQGEANAGSAQQAAGYGALLRTLITDWRTRLGQGEVPFFIVQLAGFQPRSAKPQMVPWVQIREAQAAIAASIGHSGLALAQDLGDEQDIHPKNKQEVGRRLALLAKAQVYGLPVTASGPTVTKTVVEPGRVRVSFRVQGNLGTTDKGPITGFAIAGPEGKFFAAAAEFAGNELALTAPEVPTPAFVRYAWAMNPICNLTDDSGLPAAPFRTDTLTK